MNMSVTCVQPQVMHATQKAWLDEHISVLYETLNYAQNLKDGRHGYVDR